MLYELKVIDHCSIFANHPMADTYFKYVDILKSKNMNKYAKHLTDIAYLPMNDDIRDEISDVMSALFKVINKDSDNTNEFIELGKEFDKAQVS
jgi:inhibitor of KinA sporulation pathway (predicted exonuclease)